MAVKEEDAVNGRDGPHEEDVEPFRNLCSHYSRACSLVSPCCEKVYPCRHCHDDKETHVINRFKVKEVVCRQCSHRQPVAGSCVKCLVLFARYYCSVCHLYDDADKAQFHCEGCGICRVGGKSNFFHCDKCGLCLPMSMKVTHTCVENASHSNCPVCMEDIHSSRVPAHVPKCGHLLHEACFKDMAKNGLYQCPQCQTSMMDMSDHWKSMDEECQRWLLPPQLKEFKVKIVCRDCQKECATAFHFIGFKCMHCFSYNTYRTGSEEMPLSDVDAHSFRITQDEDDDEELDEAASSDSFETPPDDENEFVMDILEHLMNPIIINDEYGHFDLPPFVNFPVEMYDLSPADFEEEEEQEEEEEEGDVVVTVAVEGNGGSQSEGWETASEEEVVGGDEQNLGKEVLDTDLNADSDDGEPSPH